jgi:hypothetical protein
MDVMLWVGRPGSESCEESLVWQCLRSSSKPTRWNRVDNISPRVEELIKDYTELLSLSELAGFGSLLLICVRNY